MEAHEQGAATEKPFGGTAGLGAAGKSGIASGTGKVMDPGIPAPPPQLLNVPPPSEFPNAAEGSVEVARIKRTAQGMEEPRDRLAKFMDDIQASAEMLEKKPDVLLPSMVARASDLKARDIQEPDRDVLAPTNGGDVTMADPAAVGGPESTIDTDPSSLAKSSGINLSAASHPDLNNTSTAQLNAVELNPDPPASQRTLPCKCGKTWVMSNCPTHASLSGVRPPTRHEIFTSAATPRTEDAGQRPKRKAASNSSAKVQELESANKRQKRDGHGEARVAKVTSVKVKVKRPSTTKAKTASTDGVQMGGSPSTATKSASTGKKQANAGKTHDARIASESASTTGAGAGEEGEGNLKTPGRRGRKRKADSDVALGGPVMEQSPQGPSHSHKPPDPRQPDAPSHTNPSISACTQSNRSEAQPQMNPAQAHAPLLSLPSEIRALIDAKGKAKFEGPPEECGFGWLGLFRILGLEEKRIVLGSGIRKDRATASAVACVQWRFRVQWMPGGEGIFKKDAAIGLDLSRPWWSIPPPPSGSGVVGMASVAAASASAVSRGLRSLSTLGSRLSAVAAGKQPERRGLDSPSVHLGSASESVSEKIGVETTTPELYLHPRQAHPSYRSAPGTELYSSLLPQPLLAEFNSFISNDVFPSGWFCSACGKVNFQVAMRHRKCTSLKCLQDTQPATTYAQDLADIRGPHSCSPCCLPFNDCSDSVLGTSTSWNNGMRTLSYYYPPSGPAEAQPEEPSPESCIRKVWVKHVFTCNLAHLQKAASEMIHVLQTEVELRRNVEDASSPFFKCAYDLSTSGGDSCE
ncbi:hypothetical protein DFP72DRAFT_1177627 [Ephemerocybe angulata]|uniref:Uncharacterized protein n=1 Tax=Ephemerocybe angulata TaxID=980116 RepID=A0A8H6HCK1_9AGAR|nr:hypothetical protein DFP72DRAFT_1177627 [Tulosesus angulatus]